jgi:hypothetical protein
MEDVKNAYKISVILPERKKPPGRPRRRWKDNIKTYVKNAVCGGVDRIEFAQNRVRGGII